MVVSLQETADFLSIPRVGPRQPQKHRAKHDKRDAAALNYGDCLAYATARAARDTLLFAGDDFSKTDIAPARSRKGILALCFSYMPALYLSAQFEDAPVLREARARLAALGYTVTSRWLDAGTAVPATAQSGDAGAGERLSAIAAQDLEDIREADAVVVYNPPESCAIGRGGRHVETGFALALGKPVVVVGARGNVFHWLPAIALVSDWTELEGWLESRR